MSSPHRRFLLLEQGLGAGVVNFLLNAAIAWLAFRGMAMVPFWGQQGIAGDTIGTCFFLPLITTLIATPLCRGRVRSGSLPPLEWTAAIARVAGWLPTGTVARGSALGLLTMVVVAPPVLIALRGLGVSDWPFATFVWFKAVFAGLLGAAVTPLVALAAIMAPRPARA